MQGNPLPPLHPIQPSRVTTRAVRNDSHGSGFWAFPGSQVIPGSLAVDIIFKLLDHLSRSRCLAIPEVCKPVSLSGALHSSVPQVNKHFERVSRHAAFWKRLLRHHHHHRTTAAA